MIVDKFTGEVLQPRVRNKFSERIAVFADTSGESLTQQQFKDDCNVNVIMARYMKTGVIEHVNRARARFGDFGDLAEGAYELEKVAKAQQAFEMLPATLRNRFDNSITGFFGFIQDPKNFDECVRMGIYDQPTKEGEAVVDSNLPKGGTPPAGVGSSSEGKAP